MPLTQWPVFDPLQINYEIDIFLSLAPRVPHSRFCQNAALYSPCCVSDYAALSSNAPTLNWACSLLKKRFFWPFPSFCLFLINSSRACLQSWPIFLSSDSTSPAIRSQRFLQRTGNSGSCSTLSSITTLCSLPRRRQVYNKGFTHKVCRLVWCPMSDLRFLFSHK